MTREKRIYKIKTTTYIFIYIFIYIYIDIQILVIDYSVKKGLISLVKLLDNVLEKKSLARVY